MSIKHELAKFGDQKKFQERILRSGSTKKADIEEKRNDVTAHREIITILFRKYKDAKTPAEENRIMQEIQQASLLANLDALGLITDCLTLRETCKVKLDNGDIVKGKQRVSTAKLLDELITYTYTIGNSLEEKVVPMLMAIGEKLGAFKDINGVPVGAEDIVNSASADGVTVDASGEVTITEKEAKEIGIEVEAAGPRSI